MKNTLLLILVIALCIPVAFPQNNNSVSSLKEAHEYVYLRSDRYNWYKNKPIFCQIIKGGYRRAKDEDTEIGNFYGFGVISGETWDKLGLREDTLYKQGEVFVVERNVCLFPNFKPSITLDWSIYKKGAFKKICNVKDAKIARIREAISPKGRYSFEILEIISKDPPLEQIFYCD